MLKNIAMIVFMLTTILEALIIVSLSQPSTSMFSLPYLAYSDFMHKVDAGEIKTVSIKGSELTGTTSNSQRFQTYLPEDPTLLRHLVSENVRVVALPITEPATGLTYFLQWVPILLLIGAWVCGMRHISRAISNVGVAVRTTLRPSTNLDKS